MNDYTIPEIHHPIDHMVASSERVAGLREQVIGLIPRWPTDEHTLSLLRRMSMNDLLSTYVNWVDRLIPPRKRRAMVWDGFYARNDPARFAAEINEIVVAIEDGRDLYPYLSSRVRTHGFVPRPSKRKGINWGDKDMALNGHDVHHLHLVPANDNGKRSGSSKELLYVGVSREEILLLMLGDHKSFDDGTLITAVSEHRAQAGHTLKGIVGLSREVSPKEASELTRHGITSPQMVGSQVAVPTTILTAGTSPSHTMHVDRCCETIEKLEPHLHDRAVLARTLSVAPGCLPVDPKWVWQFWYADLCLTDERSSTVFCVRPWQR